MRSVDDTSSQFTSILNASPDAIVSINPEGLITGWNPASERLFGYVLDELKARPITDLIPLNHRASEGAQMLAVLDSGEPVYFESGRIGKDAFYFPVACTVSAIRDEHGDVVGLVNVTRDISELRRQRTELENSESTMRATMDHAPIGMALMTPGGRWLRFNPALCELLGHDEARLRQLDYMALTHPEDLPVDVEQIGRALDGEDVPLQREKRFIHSSGRQIWVLVSMSLVRSARSLAPYFVVQFVDITERKEMERVKDEFVSVVSHELRTPLTAMRGALSLVVGVMRQDLSDRVARLLEIASTNCDRLTVLVNDLLDMDKIASGNMPMNFEPANLSSVVKQAVDMHRLLAIQNGLDLTCLVEEDGMVANIDVSRCVQVLTNLLSNAIKFSPRGATVEVVLQRQDTQACISVCDHGPGIPEAFRERIFGRFAQADSPLTRGHGGSGLGLYIAKQLAERMRGELGYDTALGQGTTFWIRLPLTVDSRLDGSEVVNRRAS